MSSLASACPVPLWQCEAALTAGPRAARAPRPPLQTSTAHRSRNSVTQCAGPTVRARGRRRPHSAPAAPRQTPQLHPCCSRPCHHWCCRLCCCSHPCDDIAGLQLLLAVLPACCTAAVPSHGELLLLPAVLLLNACRAAKQRSTWSCCSSCSSCGTHPSGCNSHHG